MSNYTNQNLINVPSNKVPAGTLAMKVGQNIFTAGRVTIEDGDAYVVQSNSGVLYARKLKFNGTEASDSATVELLSDSSVMIFNTGHPEPQGSAAPVASMDFYKCTYVNSDSWGGKKAVLNGGVYRYESNVTSGLTYGSGFTPEVGKIYSNECLIQPDLFDIPSNGLVFYAPLSSAAQTAETGQDLITIGNVTYQTVSGVPCCNSTVDDGVAVDELMGDLDPGVPKTVSCWIYITEWPSSDFSFCYMCLQSGGGTTFNVYSDHAIRADRWSPSTAASGNYAACIAANMSLNTWYNIVAVDDGYTWKLFINGIQIDSKSVGPYEKAGRYDSLNVGITCATDTSEGGFGQYNLRGYMASARIYNRALSADEVLALSKEFTPSAQ